MEIKYSLAKMRGEPNNVEDVASAYYTHMERKYKHIHQEQISKIRTVFGEF
jgi:hypothetical protein